MVLVAMGGKDNLDKAMKYYNKAIELQRDCAEAWVKRGNLCREYVFTAS